MTGRKIGHVVTPETRAKISAALKGRRTSPGTELKPGNRPHNAGKVSYTEHTCETCGTVFQRAKGYTGKKRFCSVVCAGAGKSGAKHANWKGGRCITKAGYATVRCPLRGRHYYEHVVIAERVLGRRLRKGEVVHHLNADKLDNDPRNLLICTNGYHRSLERRMATLWQRAHFPSYREAA